MGSDKPGPKTSRETVPITEHLENLSHTFRFFVSPSSGASAITLPRLCTSEEKMLNSAAHRECDTLCTENKLSKCSAQTQTRIGCLRKSPEVVPIPCR